MFMGAYPGRIKRNLLNTLAAVLSFSRKPNIYYKKLSEYCAA